MKYNRKIFYEFVSFISGTNTKLIDVTILGKWQRTLTKVCGSTVEFY